MLGHGVGVAEPPLQTIVEKQRCAAANVISGAGNVGAGAGHVGAGEPEIGTAGEGDLACALGDLPSLFDLVEQIGACAAMAGLEFGDFDLGDLFFRQCL